MRILLLSFLLVAGALGQTAPLTSEEIVKVRHLLDRAYPPPLVGQTLSPKLRATAPRGTVLVLMSSTCPHCAKEVPYFAQLDAATPTLDIIPAFWDSDVQAGAEFLSKLGWAKAPIAIHAGDLGKLRIAGTPTTLVADASGKITQAYVGELTEAQKGELAAAVKR